LPGRGIPYTNEDEGGGQFQIHKAKMAIALPFGNQESIGAMYHSITGLLVLIGASLLLGVISLSTSAADPADSHPGLNLIPWPQNVQLAEGRMKLSDKCRIVVVQKELNPLAEVLAEEIARLSALKLEVTSGASLPGDIVIKTNKSILAGEPFLAVRNRELVKTKEGAYRLTIGEQAVVEGFDYRAVAEGTATLLQALGQADGHVSLPKLAIHDWPNADYCGQLVDVARQNHPVAWLKKMIQVCRFYKVRYLHLHLTDDQAWTFPSAKYPQLGTKNFGAHGGVAPKVYALEELRDLVAYADARGVTLVPELETPGHSAAALRSLPEIFDAINPETKQPVGMGCMIMTNEAIYPALDTIIGEMCEVFRSSPYFHIGGDEVSMGRVSLHSGYKEFMKKHGLKDDHELANYFIVQVNEIVKKHGKKTLKWEGLANEASKDVIVMAWDKNNNTASHLIAKGFTTITCPWDLGVPWEEWNMYICNGSRLKKGDSVLGATLVAWEQPPETHLAGVRNVASRQERTWNPDHKVSAQGFAERFQALDAAVGKLLGIDVKPRLEATFTTSMGTRDWLDPGFAFDGNEATFYRSARAPIAGDHLTVMLKESKLIHAIEVLTGINQKGLLDGGEVQISADGQNFKTVAILKGGSAKAILTETKIRAIRLLAKSKQADPLVVREIKLRLTVEITGTVKNPAAVVGTGNVALLKGDTTFAAPMNDCDVPVINKGFTLTLNGQGQTCNYKGPISGTGKVEIHMAAKPGAKSDAALVLGGKEANTLEGTWLVKSGRVVLAKEAGIPALGGTIIVGGQSDNDGIVWNGDKQIGRPASIRLLNSAKGGAYLNLNGFHDTIDSLTMDPQTKVLTQSPGGGGVLRVGKLVIDGKNIEQGVYTSALPWVEGSGYIVVGAVKRVAVAGNVDDLHKEIGKGNMAVLKAASNIKLPAGECAIPIDVRTFPLALSTSGAAVRYTGFITGNGPLHLAAAGPVDRQPLEIAGASANAYKGPTLLVCGVLKLNKSNGALAIPGNLTLGGSSPENKGDGVIWAADGQMSPSAIVTLGGNQASFLDLAGHKVTVAKVVMSSASVIRTGQGGALKVKQLHVDGKRVPDGDYKAPQAWMQGTGTVAVDARVDVKGRLGDCHAQIGAGNIANLSGATTFSYPISDCDIDIITNGHTITFDSGDGNPFCYRGTISGKGNVVLLMGPSHTGYKDAPLRLAGTKPNTTTGKFFVRKGRVQLEKPDGVDAISGDVVVGGQGFNDCLFWVNSNQIKDSANITLISAGNSGAAYLHLNGCKETVASLTMTAVNVIKTDSASGASGVLTVRALTINGVKMPAGTYTSATAKWIEGKGEVIVQPQ
jgi:hexosaminidase